MDSPAPLSAPARFAAIIAGLCASILWRWDYPRTLENLGSIVRRVQTLNRRFQRLAALILAGKLAPERAYKPRPARESPAAPPDPGAPKPVPLWQQLPRCFGWMCVVAPNDYGGRPAAVWSAQLRALLGDAEMRALLEASPRMVRLLRPLCFGLAIESSLLPRIAPRVRKPRPARPAPTPEEAAAIAAEIAGRRPVFPSIGPPRRRRAGAGAPKLYKGYPLRYSGVSPLG